MMTTTTTTPPPALDRLTPPQVKLSQTERESAVWELRAERAVLLEHHSQLARIADTAASGRLVPLDQLRALVRLLRADPDQNDAGATTSTAGGAAGGGARRSSVADTITAALGISGVGVGTADAEIAALDAHAAMMEAIASHSGAPPTGGDGAFGGAFGARAARGGSDTATLQQPRRSDASANSDDNIDDEALLDDMQPTIARLRHAVMPPVDLGGALAAARARDDALRAALADARAAAADDTASLRDALEAGPACAGACMWTMTSFQIWKACCRGK